MDESVTEVTATPARPTGPFVRVTAMDGATLAINLGDVIRIEPAYAADDARRAAQIKGINGASVAKPLPVPDACIVHTHRDFTPVKEPLESLIDRFNIAWTVSQAEIYRRGLDGSLTVQILAASRADMAITDEMMAAITKRLHDGLAQCAGLA